MALPVKSPGQKRKSCDRMGRCLVQNAEARKKDRKTPVATEKVTKCNLSTAVIRKKPTEPDG
jgi:hypothetical protein